MTLTVRRVVAVAALGGALVTAGCGSLETNRAATVDGHVITETQLQTVRSQINTAFPQANLTSTDALTLLIRAPYIVQYGEQQGKPQSESAAAQAFPGQNPSPETVELLRAELTLQNVDQAALQNDLVPVLQKLKVQVNPRYGQYNPEQAAITTSSPNWITPYNAK